MPENGGTSFDVRDVMIVDRRLLWLMKKNRRPQGTCMPSFIKNDEHVFFRLFTEYGTDPPQVIRLTQITSFFIV